ncbi:MAG: transporter substrate-binding domain-containing protein [Pseudomonadota bacterium]|nr:transporter substrate-binding domain-containing protein [Pseudomonadota bacterium]
MVLRPAVLGLLGVFAVSVCQAQAPALDLFTYEAPPHQVSQADDLGRTRAVGETVDTVMCAAGRSGRTTRVRVTPPNRALYSLRRNLIDGYFAIDPSPELDAIATRTDPVALAKWYFFSAREGIDLRHARIGVVAGSHESSWLTHQGYEIALSVATPRQLVALLRLNRIDAALMDEQVMAGLNVDTEGPGADLHSRFVRFAPLYLYFSDRFTRAAPEFAGRFNRFLPGCMKTALNLSDSEQAFLRQQARKLLMELNASVSLDRALTDGPRLPTFADILNIDKQWQALAPDQSVPLADQLLALPASRALRAWQDSHRGLVTEALLITKSGTLAAMSQLTSDYWQGDEAKFRENIRKAVTARFEESDLYLSPVRYDASTRQFQVMVSAPLNASDGSGNTGVIALGLNISQALQGLER